MRWSEGDTASSVPERFAQQVAQDPCAIAIADGSGTLTYGELLRLSHRYAQALAPIFERCADEHGARALLLLEHGASLIGGALAALEAGFTILTLNPSDPPARWAEVRAAVRPSVLLSDETRLAGAGAAGLDDLETLVLSRGLADGGAEPAARSPAPDDLAFLISTSGSTGRPKVIMQSHRNMLHSVLRYTNALGITPQDRIAWFTSLGGAQGLATVWTALLNGATLCPFPVLDRGMVGLSRWLTDNGVTVLDISPSFLRSFTRGLGRERVSGVRLVRLGSEAALRSDFDAFKRHFPADCTLASVLASSETGMVSVALLRHDDDPPPGNLPVGSELEGVRLRLLDDQARGVREGEIGEIVIEGRYVSPGYWGDPQLTAERFESEPGVRRYRTGDLGRRLASGSLQVIGRSDFQVKVRGHRLQLEEVEGALAAQPGVAAAAVALHSSERGDTRLAGYVVSVDGARLDAVTLRSSLAAVLPAHAIPASLVCVDSLPFTPTGKLDRARLRELEVAFERGPDAGEAESRRVLESDPMLELGEVRRHLQRIWEEVLDQGPIGHDEDFFALGGDSLAAMHMLVGIEKQFCCALTPGVLLRAPTIQRLAGVIYRAGPRVLPQEEGSAADGAGAPPLFIAYPLGGHGLRYRPLAQALGSELRLHVLESPWWDGRPTEIHTAQQLAAHHVLEIRHHQPSGPYMLAGYSGGGLIALEVARQLRDAGEEIGLLAVIDTYIAIKRGAGMDPRNRARRATAGGAAAPGGGLALWWQTTLWRAAELAKRAIAGPTPSALAAGPPQARSGARASPGPIRAAPRQRRAPGLPPRALRRPGGALPLCGGHLAGARPWMGRGRSRRARDPRPGGRPFRRAAAAPRGGARICAGCAHARGAAGSLTSSGRELGEFMRIRGRACIPHSRRVDYTAGWGGPKGTLTARFPSASRGRSSARLRRRRSAASEVR
jgi:amino acid adenylation domain-containing protein